MKTKAILELCNYGYHYRSTNTELSYSVCSYTLHEFFPRLAKVKRIRAYLQSYEPHNKRGWFCIKAVNYSNLYGRCFNAVVEGKGNFSPIRQLSFDLMQHPVLWCRLVAVRSLPVENKAIQIST